MTPKQIKDQMSSTPWTVEGRSVIADRYGATFRTQHLAEAACTAVNNTYGKGYDPECMDEMYKWMRDLCDNLDYGISTKVVSGGDRHNHLKNILNKAKI